MLREELDIETERPEESPPSLGYSIIVGTANPAMLLRQFRQVWRVVASWGRFSDEGLGDWPSNEQCLEALPADFVSVLRTSRPEDIEGWLGGLHDREWVLWSSAVIDNLVKIDLAAEAMPISASPVRLVAELLGGEVLSSDLWHPTVIAHR
jgi:hypothetical protein